MFKEMNCLPDGILELEAHQLFEVLQGPALIHLKGKKKSTLFVSVLLHGNEPVGWDAISRLLKNYIPGGGRKELPRNLSIFIGNTEAAAQKLRRLEGQVDYNRVWPGGNSPGKESEMMQQVVDTMVKRSLFASLDIHNNTGINPHYGCINKIDNRFFRLALMFRRLVIYFTKPTGVQSLAFAEHCPAITIEAGKAGDESGVTHTEEFIDECLHMHELSDDPLNHLDMDLYHTVATVKIPASVSFDFKPGNDICFENRLDKFNFSDLPAGTGWGEVTSRKVPLEVISEEGYSCAEKYFKIESGKLINKVPVMPAMLTKDRRVIRQDCLCYLMERYQQ